MTTFILGPAVCQACRKPVYWNGIEWCAPSGLEHACRVQPKITGSWLKRAAMRWLRR